MFTATANGALSRLGLDPRGTAPFPRSTARMLMHKADRLVSLPDWTYEGAATLQARTGHREVTDEGDCGDGSGCGNGRDEVDAAARAAGVGRELRRCRCSGLCVGIHRG